MDEDELIELVYEIKSGKDCPQCCGKLQPHEYANGQDLTVCDSCSAVFCNGKLISDAWEGVGRRNKRTAATVAVEAKLKEQYDKVAVYESVHGFLRVRVIDKRFENVPMSLRVPAIAVNIPLKLRRKISYALLAPSELYSELGRGLNDSFVNDT